MSGALNQSIQVLEELVQKVSGFSGQTIEQATFFRNQLAVSLTDIISLWQGVKAGWESFASAKRTSELKPFVLIFVNFNAEFWVINYTKTELIL